MSFFQTTLFTCMLWRVSASICNENNQGMWIFEAETTPTSNTEHLIDFGGAIDISGENLLVGDFMDTHHGELSGRAFIFNRQRETNNVEWIENHVLERIEPEVNDAFAASLAIHGDIAVVGNPNDHLDPHPLAGTVRVFQNVDNHWNEVAILQPSDPSAYLLFGTAVAVYENTIVVGTYPPLDDNFSLAEGAVYIFTRQDDGSWMEQQKLTNSYDLADLFGVSVSIHDDTIVVGAPFGDDTRGAAYVYKRDDNGLWAQEEALLPNGRRQGSSFGVSVSVHGETLAIGSYGNDMPDEDTIRGTVWVFVRAPQAEGIQTQQETPQEVGVPGVFWIEQDRLTPSNRRNSEDFGVSVAIYGDVIVTGDVRYDYDDTEDSGAAFVFERTGESWTEAAVLTAPRPFRKGGFGTAVAIDNNRVAVGSSPLRFSGAAYMFLKCPREGEPGYLMEDQENEIRAPSAPPTLRAIGGEEAESDEVKGLGDVVNPAGEETPASSAVSAASLTFGLSLTMLLLVR